MVVWLMIGGIGALVGCLLTLTFVPLVHQRAVRLTTRNMIDTVPFALSEIRADKDHLRAEFAMSLRRLEVNIDEMKTKAASQLAEIGRKHAEIGGLKAELEKRAALILALRARWQLHHSVTRRMVKVLLYLLVRSGRRRRQRFFTPLPVSATVHALAGNAVDREAA